MDQQAYYQTLMDNSPCAVINLDVEGKILAHNPAAERLLGYDPKQIVGKTIDAFMAKEYIETVEAVDVPQILSRQEKILIASKEIPQESHGDIELQIIPVIAKDKEIGYIGICHDISELERVDEELRNQKDYFEAIFNNSPVAVVTAALDGEVLSWNPAAETLFGYTQEEAVGRHIDDIVAQDDSIRAEAATYTDQVLNMGRLHATTKRTRKDGSMADVEILAFADHPVIVGGEKVGYIVIYHDISERKRIEEELRHQKEYYESLFNNIPAAVVTEDLDGRVVSWNPVAEKLFGYTQEEAVGRHVDDLVAKDESIQEEARSFTTQTLHGERVETTTQRNCKDGSLVDVELMALPVSVAGERIGLIAIYHDITELKEIEHELRQQKEYFESLFVNNPVAVVTADLDANIVSWNPSAEKLFGYSQEEVIGRNLDEIVAKDESLRDEAVGYWDVMFDLGHVEATSQRNRKDGSLVDVDLLALPVIVAEEMVGIIAIYHDISPLKESERELRRQKEYYEALFMNNPVAVVTNDMKGRVVSWNQAAERLFGYTQDEAIDRYIDELVANDDAIRAEAVGYTESIQEEPGEIAKSWRLETTTKRTRKDGSLVDVDLLGLPVIVEGKAIGVIVLYHDISERIKMEDELRYQKDYYEALFVNSPVAVVTADMEAKIISWNPSAERLFGYSQDEVVGRNLVTAVAQDDSLRAEAAGHIDQIFNLGHVEATTKRTRKDGSQVDVDLLSLPVIVAGEMVGFIAIYHDISPLQEARRSAEAANQAKSDFLARMSHELRTPLNAIIGFTRIVKRKGSEVLPEKQLDNLDKVLVSADHLLDLIDDVLDLSKIEAGRIEVEPSTFEIEPLVDLCITTTQPLIRLEQIALIKEIEKEVPAIYSDQNKVKQILLNLLGNAAKFTHEGQIKVGVSCDNDTLIMSVTDTGIGIPEEALDRIFEDFQQVDTSTTREYGGTGLGLSISHRLARLLGGDLVASSTEGEGSTFTLTIPLQYRA